MTSPVASVLTISKVQVAKKKKCKEHEDQWCAEIHHFRSEPN